MFAMKTALLLLLGCQGFNPAFFMRDKPSTDSFGQKIIAVSKKPLNGYVFQNDQVWAVADTNIVYHWNLKDDSVHRIVLDKKSKTICIAKDKEQNIVIGLESGQILKLMPGQTWKQLAFLDEPVQRICFTKANRGFAITRHGIVSVDRNENYVPAQSNNNQIHFQENSMPVPSCSYIDSQDNIWLGFAFGEWGGDLHIFSTSKREFIKTDLKALNITLSPILSVFEDKNNRIYITSGLMHFSYSGYLVQVTNFVETQTYDKGSSRVDSLNEYIGPGAYNPYNNLLYYYSNKGFKIQVPVLNTLMFAEFYNPKLSWSYGQSNAVGYQMNVQSFEFIAENKMLFLSPNNGIGYYDGSEIKLYK